MEYKQFLVSISDLHDLVLNEYNYLLKVKPEIEPNSYYKKKLALIKQIKQFILKEYKLFQKTLNAIINTHEKGHRIIVKRHLGNSIFDLKLYSSNFSSYMFQIHEIEKFENKIKKVTNNYDHIEYTLLLKTINNLLFAIKDIIDQLLNIGKTHLDAEKAILNIQKNLYYIDGTLLKHDLKSVHNKTN